MPEPTAPTDTDFWRWVALVTEVLGLALTLYFLWEYAPERWKIGIRGWVRGARRPLDAIDARKHERAEMLRDVIELITYGVPSEWVQT